MKKLAIDSYYYSDTICYSVGVIFNYWNSKVPDHILEWTVSDFAPYIPGQFYKRELPGVLSIINQVNLNEFDTIILDGFANLIDDSLNSIPGLGEKLEAEIEMNPNLSIIGVAKSLFGRSDLISLPVYRGNAAKNPLWVSVSSGSKINVKTAKKHIESMYGECRLPDILKFLDKHTKRFL